MAGCCYLGNFNLDDCSDRIFPVPIFHRKIPGFLYQPDQPAADKFRIRLSSLPDYSPEKTYESVERSANSDTVLPTGVRNSVTEYKVASGDSLFGIAEEYEVDPETILWANYDILNDDPHLISVGDELKIPPVDGILYQWQTYDTLEAVAAKYHADVDDILLFPGNDLDITNPVIEPGTFIMIPGGYRDTQATWVVAVTAGSNAGVTAQIAGPGSCTPTGGYVGTYSFVWPAPYYGQVSGNDYWSGHQAIDAMCYEGDSIFASDSGVVIYAGSHQRRLRKLSRDRPSGRLHHAVRSLKRLRGLLRPERGAGTSDRLLRFNR